MAIQPCGVPLDRETMARFSITAMAADSSGWAKASACDHLAISPPGLASDACQKAALSRDPRELPPGRYTVILEPAAVLDLAGQMVTDFSATAIRDGRSFLNDRIGVKLFGENITIHDDVYHRGQAGAASMEKASRAAASSCGSRRGDRHRLQPRGRRSQRPSTGHGFPCSTKSASADEHRFAGGGTIEEMVAGTDRGILVTRLWYIREVDPYQKIFTGMTRDGTFLVEGGRVVVGVRNFRFNQNILEMLSNVGQMGPAVRAAGEESFEMVVPAMKVRDFNFTEVTRF
jgi:predicted Zn-dependent protease